MQARSKLLFTDTANNKSESTLCSFAHALIYAHIIVYKVYNFRGSGGNPQKNFKNYHAGIEIEGILKHLASRHAGPIAI